jgi:hypothetical protein
LEDNVKVPMSGSWRLLGRSLTSNPAQHTVAKKNKSKMGTQTLAQQSEIVAIAIAVMMAICAVLYKKHSNRSAAPSPCGIHRAASGIDSVHLEKNTAERTNCH